MKKVVTLIIVCLLVNCSNPSTNKKNMQNLINNGTNTEPIFYTDNNFLFNGIIYNEDSSGNLIFEGYVKDGRFNGHYISRYKDRKLKVEGNYIDNKKDGLWEFSNYEGYLDSVIKYKMGDIEYIKRLGK